MFHIKTELMPKSTCELEIAASLVLLRKSSGQLNLVFGLEDAGAICFHLIIAYKLGCFIGLYIPQPTDHTWPMVTMSRAQLKLLMLLKTL